jgi:hypothetical protein
MDTLMERAGGVVGKEKAWSQHCSNPAHRGDVSRGYAPRPREDMVCCLVPHLSVTYRGSEPVLSRRTQEDTPMTQNSYELPPPMPKDPQYVPPPRDPERPGPHIVAEVIPIEDQLKVGHVQGFTVRCDESGRVGGTDSAPSPLGYFTVAVGF